MGDWYRVDLEIPGVGKWTIAEGDPADYGPTTDLRIFWEFPEDECWPPQPTPVEASFGLVLPAPVGGLDVGADVGIIIMTTNDGEPWDGSHARARMVAEFVGHLTEVEATAVAQGILYRCKAADWLADAAETTLRDRLDADATRYSLDAYADLLAGEAGLPPITRNPVPATAAIFHGIGRRWTDYYTAMSDLLRSIAFLQDGDDTGLIRVLLVPNDARFRSYYGGPDGTEPSGPAAFTFDPPEGPYTTVYISDRGTRSAAVNTDYPLRLVQAGGLWDLSVKPGARRVVPASAVEREPAGWRRGKERAVNTIVAPWIDTTGTEQTATATTGKQPPVSRTLPTLHTTSATGAKDVAELHRRAGDANHQADAFQADAFVLHGPAVAEALLPGGDFTVPGGFRYGGWFNFDHNATMLWFDPTILIEGIPDRWNPNRSRWYAGAVTGAEVQVYQRPGGGGSWRLTFKLGQAVPRQGTAQQPGRYVSYADLRANPTTAAITYDQVSPEVTYYDTRLLGKD